MTAPPGTILIIDDDEVDVFMLERLFRKSNLPNPILVAKDGIEAFTTLRGGGDATPLVPCLIALDWNMPRMNGHEFLTELRADEQLKDCNVVVISTSDVEADIQSARQFEVAAYIVKDSLSEEFGTIISLIAASE